MRAANKLLRESCLAGQFAVTYASQLRVQGVWPIMQISPFNGPIAAQATCKATRRQRASASDWPAGPPQRRKSRTTHPMCSSKKVQDK